MVDKALADIAKEIAIRLLKITDRIESRLSMLALVDAMAAAFPVSENRRARHGADAHRG